MSAPVSNYQERKAALPDMEVNGLGPRAMTAEDVDAVMACTNAAALAQMSAYARSYFGTAGGIVLGVAGATVATLLGRRSLAIASAVGAATAALGTIEVRRRARQWDAVIQARLAALATARD